MPEEAAPVSSVLVAIDASDQSWMALSFAVDFVKRNPGAKLYIVHSVPNLVMPVAGDMAQSAYIVMDQRDALVEAGKSIIEKALKHARNSGLEDADGSMETGNAVDVILSMASKKGSDVIILGNRGMGFKQGILLGSVSERVVANSPVTVIVVK